MSYIGKGVEVVTFNTATTLDVAGNITVGGTVDGRDVATDGTKLDTITSGAIADILQDTTPQLGGNLDLNTSNVIGTGNINVTGSITGTSFVSTGDMSFTNNSKAIFGTSPSLEIYHDGSNSILDDVGAGNFKMQLAGADKLEITSTGVDVTGTVTATAFSGDGSALTGITIPTLSSLGIANHDDITVDGSGNVLVGKSTSNYTTDGLEFRSDGQIFSSVGSDYTAYLNRKSTDGDILVLAKDAATVGSIGTSSGFLYAGHDDVGLIFRSNESIRPYNPSTTSERDAAIDLGHGLVRFKDLYLSGKLTNNGTGGINIDTSGNVGIGTSSPTSNRQLTLYGNDAGLQITGSAAGSNAYLTSTPGSGANFYFGTTSAKPIIFVTNGATTERMRIDSSGNLLVGTTDTLPAINNVEGIALSAGSFGGRLEVSRDNSEAVSINRKTSDGSLMSFKKDGTTVGSIGKANGSASQGLFISGDDVGFSFEGHTNNAITPYSTDTGNRDDAVDLGASGARFKNLYLSGGVYLGGTGSANHLDDYEEGTWTPVIDSGAFTSVTYGQQYGTYTKVGNLVTAYITLRFSGTSAGGEFRINGLPFASKFDSAAKGMFIAYSTASTYLTEGNPNMYIGSNQTYIRAYKSDGNAANSNANASSDWFEGVVVYNAA